MRSSSALKLMLKSAICRIFTPMSARFGALWMMRPASSLVMPPRFSSERPDWAHI
jgi:hypothetical protein